jgi:predicted amidohydrolase
MNIIVATSAFEGVVDDLDLNLKELHRYIDDAADGGASLVVFPECALQGYPPLAMHDKAGLQRVWASAVDIATDARVAEIAEHAIARSIHVIYGLHERGGEPGVIYNSAVLVGPQGYIGTYRKVHLGNSEQQVWRRGSHWPVFDTAIGKIGMLICVDKAWPESTRELTFRGAELLIMPTAWGFDTNGEDPVTGVWADMYLTFEKARAMENSRWFIGSNFAGDLGGKSFPGQSRIIDPLGRIVATTGSEPGLAFATIDVAGGIAEAQATWFGPRLIRERRAETYTMMTGAELPVIDG